MFRKPKRAANKATLRSTRSKVDDDDEEDDGRNNQQEEDLNEDEQTPGDRRSNKRIKASSTEDSKKDVLHQYETSTTPQLTASELATRTAQHHPEAISRNNHTNDTTTTTVASGRGVDGIYRETTRNPFLAGPIKASTNVRMTSRFDYQPDICKDYKDTGFCGYGDTCIYLHDRGDTLSGWQLEEQWQEQQKLKQQQQQAEMEAFADGNVISNNNKTKKEGSAVVLTEDGLPFACHICRQPFTDPIVTSCGHYFCEACIVEQMRSSLSSDSTHCPICRKDTHGVLNQPTKLLAKKRRLVGANASWKEFADACAAKKA